jgi:hypothetical protein
VNVAALVEGRLLSDPEQHTTPLGNRFTLTQVAAGTAVGDIAVTVIAFGEAGEHLAALKAGAVAKIRGDVSVRVRRGVAGSMGLGPRHSAEVVLTASPTDNKHLRAALEGQL